MSMKTMNSARSGVVALVGSLGFVAVSSLALATPASAINFNQVFRTTNMVLQCGVAVDVCATPGVNVLFCGAALANCMAAEVDAVRSWRE